MKVLIAESKDVVREGLKQVVATALANVSIMEVASLSKAIDEVRRVSWDLVIVDSWFPDGAGLALLEEVRRSGLHSPALVLSLYADAEYAIRSIRAGAKGYISKDAHSIDFVAAIRVVTEGGEYLPPSLQSILLTAESDAERPLYEVLGQREFLILGMTCRGMTVKAIAAGLGLSPKTVNNVRSSLLKKLRLDSTNALIKYGIEHGIGT